MHLKTLKAVFYKRSRHMMKFITGAEKFIRDANLLIIFNSSYNALCTCENYFNYHLFIILYIGYKLLECIK